MESTNAKNENLSAEDWTKQTLTNFRMRCTNVC